MVVEADCPSIIGVVVAIVEEAWLLIYFTPESMVFPAEEILFPASRRGAAKEASGLMAREVFADARCSTSLMVEGKMESQKRKMSAERVPVAM